MPCAGADSIHLATGPLAHIFKTDGMTVFKYHYSLSTARSVALALPHGVNIPCSTSYAAKTHYSLTIDALLGVSCCERGLSRKVAENSQLHRTHRDEDARRNKFFWGLSKLRARCRKAQPRLCTFSMILTRALLRGFKLNTVYVITRNCT